MMPQTASEARRASQIEEVAATRELSTNELIEYEMLAQRSFRRVKAQRASQ